MRESGEDVAFELWESVGFVGGVPVEHDPRIGAPDDRPRVWRLTIYRTGSPITLTDVLPRLQHLGVDVVDEHPYEFSGPGLTAEPFWIYDFGLRPSGARPARPQDRADAATAGPGRTPAARPSPRPRLEPGEGPGRGRAGRPVARPDRGRRVQRPGAGRAPELAPGRDAARLRQVPAAGGTRFSQSYIERVLRANVTVTRLLVRLFESRFDPDHQAGERERSEAIAEEIRGELDDVASLDQDRILRAYWGLISGDAADELLRRPGAGTHRSRRFRTWWSSWTRQPCPTCPRPGRSSSSSSTRPRFEGVHLRFGAVARGGLRWSDRREDFRTEILGLVKAQMVKNAVIVPTGAKGGFVCKQLPDPADREAYQGEVLACYRTFISAMLDVTDNLEAGQVVPPARVVRHDGDDPYLVVAADKGTATFSDTANEIAAELRVLAGRRVRLRRLRGLRPQEDGHHRARRLGVGQVPLPGARHGHPDRRLHRGRRRRHVR